MAQGKIGGGVFDEPLEPIAWREHAFPGLPGCPLVSPEPATLWRAMQYLLKRGWQFRLRTNEWETLTGTEAVFVTTARTPEVAGREPRFLSLHHTEESYGTFRLLHYIFSKLNQEAKINVTQIQS